MKIYEILLGIIMLGVTQLSHRALLLHRSYNRTDRMSGAWNVIERTLFWRNEHEKYNNYYESVICCMGWI